MYTAMEIARYIIDKRSDENRCVTNRVLNEILFLLQRDYVAEHDELLFPDEIVAMHFGPAVPDVYQRYAGYGSLPIFMNYDTDIDNYIRAFICKTLLNYDDRKIIREQACGPDSAWYAVYDEGRGLAKVIPMLDKQDRGEPS